MSREDDLRSAAARGKYSALYHFLLARPAEEWEVDFSRIEKILGFDLPRSARVHRPWWANVGVKGGHSHALAWEMAGWKTARVDMEAETVTFIPPETPAPELRGEDEVAASPSPGIGKYEALYLHLLAQSGDRWDVTFSRIEEILGFPLPASARNYRPWWANQKGKGTHTQSRAWVEAGWDTSRVDLENETLIFIRVASEPETAIAEPDEPVEIEPDAIIDSDQGEPGEIAGDDQPEGESHEPCLPPSYPEPAPRRSWWRRLLGL